MNTVLPLSSNFISTLIEYLLYGGFAILRFPSDFPSLNIGLEFNSKENDDSSAFLCKISLICSSVYPGIIPSCKIPPETFTLFLLLFIKKTALIIVIITNIT